MVLNLIGVARARGGGASIDLASPPPIGNVAPNTGAFTTLSATGDTAIGAAAAVSSRLYVVSSDNGAGAFARFFANNLTIGLGFGYNSIQALGNAASLSVSILAKGTGSSSYVWLANDTPETGIRFGSADANNTIWFGDRNVGITANTGRTISIGLVSAALTTGLTVLTTTGVVTAKASDAATATVTNVLTLGHETSGTPAASYGTGLLLQGESSTTSNRDMARLRALWTTATDASRVANLVLSVWNIGVETDVLTLSPTLISAVLPTTITSTGTDYGTKALTVRNSSLTGLFSVTSDGRVYVGTDTGAAAYLTVTKASGSALNLASFKDNSQTGTPELAFTAGANNMQIFLANVATGKIHFGAGGISTQQATLDVALGNWGVGVTSPLTRLHAVITDAVTNTVTNAHTLGHESSGTPAQGFGVGAVYQLKSTAGGQWNAAVEEASWDDATHASRAGAMERSVYLQATKQPYLKAIANLTGGVKTAVNGATPVIRAAHIADPTGGTPDAEARTAINAILVALENFGILLTV